MNTLILGNLISLGASVCLAASCCAKNKKSAYRLQAAESAVLCGSYLVFSAWAGLVTQVLSVLRNLLVIRGKFSVKWMVFFTALAVVLGVAVNDRGLIGLLPVAATVQLTLCNHFCRTLKQVKVSFLVTAFQWLTFSFCIGDYVNAATQVVVMTLCVISLVRLTRKERKAPASA